MFSSTITKARETISFKESTAKADVTISPAISRGFMWNISPRSTDAPNITIPR
jgi:hypothetical protein